MLKVLFLGTNAITLFNFSQQQQLQAQHLSHGHGLPVPLTPHPSGLQPPTIPPIGSSAGLLALSSALGGQSHLPIKDEKKHHDSDHQRGKACFLGFSFSEKVASDVKRYKVFARFLEFLFLRPTLVFPSAVTFLYSPAVQSELGSMGAVVQRSQNNPDLERPFVYFKL